MVPRRAAQQRLAPLALPLPAGGVPVRATWSRRTRGARKLEPEYELLDTGDLRRRPLLDRRGPLREGGPDRHPEPDHASGTWARGGDDPRPADALVPQRLVVGPGRPHRPIRDGDGDGSRILASHPELGDYELLVGAGPDGAAAGAAVLRERDERTRGSTAPQRRRRSRRTASTTTSSPGRRRSTRPGPARRRRRGTGSPSSPARRPRSGSGSGAPAAALPREADVEDLLGAGVRRD